MARPLRIEFPGAFYHVMNRGNTGMDIYRSKRDLSGYVESPGWLETDWLLLLFAENRDTAKKGYRDFVESVENEKIENPSDDVAGGVVLGPDDRIRRKILNI